MLTENRFYFSFAVIIIKFPGSGMSKGLLAGIIIGAFSCGVVLIMAIIFIFNKTHPRVLQRKASKYKPSKSVYLGLDGTLRTFSWIM